MFLDASIIVAIAVREAGWEGDLARLKLSSGPYFYSATVRYEAVIAIARISSLFRGVRTNAELLAEAETVFDAFVDNLPAEEIDISPAIGRGALSAAKSYGKIVGHKAQLNFGDCFAYAAAKSLDVGLLYKGDDFALTDLA
jgi:ribonuclease VapC